MSMEPLEKQIRNLPWRQPPETLKDRIFETSSPNAGRDQSRLFLATPIARAALVLVPIGLIAFLVARHVLSPSLASPASSPVIVVETHEDDPHLFDLTRQSEELWPGTLTLVVEAN
ncbi:MAG: hypothetical protein AAF514_09460 [Verrucomicrobiota bacterium]